MRVAALLLKCTLAPICRHPPLVQACRLDETPHYGMTLRQANNTHAQTSTTVLLRQPHEIDIEVVNIVVVWSAAHSQAACILA